jgi:hypothetical protein
MGRSRDRLAAKQKRRWPHLSDVGSAAVLQLAHRWALGSDLDRSPPGVPLYKCRANRAQIGIYCYFKGLVKTISPV